MAHNTATHVPFGQLRVGDLMFFASDGGSNWSDVDHVAIYLGNDWMVHSASSNDGVLLESVSSTTYYYGEFVFGRHVIGVSSAPSHGSVTKHTLLEGDAR